MYNNWLHKDILRKLHVSMHNNMQLRLESVKVLQQQRQLPLHQLPLQLKLTQQFTSNIYSNSWAKDMMKLLQRNMHSSMLCNMHSNKVEFCLWQIPITVLSVSDE
jgi:hypothetical protein